MHRLTEDNLGRTVGGFFVVVVVVLLSSLAYVLAHFAIFRYVVKMAKYF